MRNNRHEVLEPNKQAQEGNSKERMAVAKENFKETTMNILRDKMQDAIFKRNNK